MSDLRNKLIRIERTINIYDRANKLINEINVDIPLEALVQIINPNDDDPELFDGYELNASQLYQINGFIGKPIQPEWNEFSYYLVTGGIYDWSK